MWPVTLHKDTGRLSERTFTREYSSGRAFNDPGWLRRLLHDILEGTSLQSTCILVMTPFARAPKRSEHSVSAASLAAGEQQMIRAKRSPNCSVFYSSKMSSRGKFAIAS